MANQTTTACDDPLEHALTRVREVEGELSRLRLGLEAANVGLWEWDLRTNRAYFSPEYKRQLGYADHEFANEFSEWEARVHPDDLPRVLAMVRAFIVKPWPNYVAEFRLRHKDGSYRWILAQASLAFDGDGHAVRMLGSHVDITARKLAEQALAEREAQLTLCIEYCPAAVAMFDREMRYLAVSRRWLSDYKLDMHVVGLSHYDVFPEIPERWREVHRRCLAGAIERCDEDSFLRKDGTVEWTRWEVRPWRDALGEVGGIAIFSEVISARKEAEVALRESQERLRLAVNGADLGTWHWNLQSGELIWSDRCCAMFGIPAGTTMTYERFLAALPAEERGRVEQALQRTLRKRSEYDIELRYLWPDGSSHWAAIRGRAFYDGSGLPQRMEGVALDMTRHRQLEQELIQAQKLEAIGQLAGGVAHDFNNILTVVLGQAFVLGMQPNLPPGAATCARDIVSAAERGASLTAQLLAFGRRQIMQRRVVDLSCTVRDAISMLECLVGERIVLTFEAPPQNAPALVFADPNMLVQVLLNLAVNARDAMPNGGRLSIRVGIEALDASSLDRIAGATPGKWACLTVSDTGYGIAKEVLPHLFEPFFTTKGVGKGTGLGLSTAYGIVQQHGGGISFESAPGLGTTCRIVLPLSKEAATDGLPAPKPASQSGHDETILLVEDDSAVRSMLTEMLVQHGYSVIAANNGKMAQELWAQHQSSIALVLSDVVMPSGITGPELVATLRAEAPHLKAILMSGHGAEVLGQEFKMDGNVSFLQKPYSPAQLLSAIARALVPRAG